MTKRLLILGLAVAIGLFFYWDLGRFLTLNSLKATHLQLLDLQLDSPWQVGTLFFCLCVAITALSLPGNTLLMLAAGALFGLGLGTLLISFAFSMGATLAFLLARHLLREPIQNRFSQRLAMVNQGLASEGVSYLLTLRLLPIIPSSLVNLLMGLTTIPAATFYWVTQLGTLAATLIYVRAGTQLAQIQQPADVLSVELFSLLIALALLPLLARQLLKREKKCA
ncbi:MAG: TVP38/TMEM64 family protein [Magnetococcales bacterium]|nr:TVP38/TMEM64 family protein [Magnetococcales bacterium]